MSWTVIPNAHQPHSRGVPFRSEGLFIRKCGPNSYQVYVSKELSDALGPCVRVWRDGHRFRLESASEDAEHARLITGRDSATVRKFCCKELFNALDDGRIYVKEVREGVYEL